MGQGIGDTEVEAERSNQTLRVSVLGSACVVKMKNGTSLVRQFWPFFDYKGFQFNELIAIYCRINPFTLWNGLVVDYAYPV